MRVLVPDTQDSWSDIDWSMFNFINHLSTQVDQYDLPGAYYDSITRVAMEQHQVPIAIVWIDVDTWVQEPAGWDLNLTDQELTAFVLKWR